ncbi:MAG TPA: hypothetical protein VGB75_04515 [Jatrophihabitans sp.]|jgi:hypothetical protein|uniref:hypothetical protein n=1 Tax=Jatrophihabitans sp. TaxID=1932789 RepID=UPI002EF8193F
MSLRRIAGFAVAAVVASGAGLLLSGPSGAVTPPTPITLNLTGMSSTSCPLPLNGSMAVVPNTTVLLKNDPTLAALSTESVTIKPAPNSLDPASSKVIADIPDAGAPIAFTRAATYSLSWQIRSLGGTLSNTQKGKLIITGSVKNCAVAVQLPVPSLSASAVPSAVTSGINGAIGGAVSSVNGALGPVNSALPTLPTVPALPSVPGAPSLPGVNLPGASAPAGNQGPGTNYKPTGPTVADRTVPDGYGSGSGLGGVFVPATGDSAAGSADRGSIVAGQQTGVSDGRSSAGSAAPAKAASSPRTTELASSQPRSALGALPTLAVILAILALSGATAFYARTFLLQPVTAQAKAIAKH